MTDRLVTAPSPVIELDGTARGDLGRDLLHLEVAHDTLGMKSLVMHLLGADPAGVRRVGELPLLSGNDLDFGKQVVCSVGPAGEHRFIFDGHITGLEARFAEGGMPTVVAYAEDDLMKLRMTRRSRTYEDVTDAELAETIASEHGLASETAADGPTYDVVQQFAQTDLAFLRERAELVQAELWLDDGTLNFTTREHRTGTELTLVQGNELLDVRVRADLAHQRSAVHVTGYDVAGREAIDEEAGVSVVQAEVTGGRLGADVLAQAIGEFPTHRVREVPIDRAEAAAWARAEMLRRSRRFVTVAGTTDGSADMVVGSRLTLERVGAPFAGAGYYVTKVRHTFDRSTGFRTHFEAERATIAESAA